MASILTNVYAVGIIFTYAYGSAPVGANCVRPSAENNNCGRTTVRPYHRIINTYRKIETAPASAGTFLLRELAACELIAVCFVAFVARRASILTNVYAVGIVFTYAYGSAPVGANCVRPPVENNDCGRTQFAPTVFIHIVKQKQLRFPPGLSCCGS